MSYFTTYIDDSGTAPDQRVAMCTALIIPAARIIAMEREWKTLKEKEGFSDFHTSVFIARNYKTEFAKWDDDKQERVFRRVREIIKKFGVKIYTFAVNKKDYDEVIPDSAKGYIGDHYTWAVRHVIGHLAAWRKSRRVVNPLQYLYDWMEKNDPKRKEIEEVMEQAEMVAEQIGMAGEYENFDFRRRKDHAGLQCVDAIAWTSYQISMHAIYGTPMHPMAHVAWEDLLSRNTEVIAGPFEWLTAFSVSRNQLEEWLDTASPDTMLIAKFKELKEAINEKRKPRVQGVRQSHGATAKGSSQRDESQVGRRESGESEKAEG